MTSMFRRGPLAFAEHRQTRAVDDEMQPVAPRRSAKRDGEVLTAPGERRVIGRRQVDAQESEHRYQKALGLAERQVEDETQRQGCFNGDVRILPLPYLTRHESLPFQVISLQRFQ